MKTEITDVSETQKTVTIEIESSVVDAEIDRIAKGYKQARVPGFRPGKVPADDHQAAVSRPDPQRGDARAHPARRRRGAPGARHRADRYAECPRCRARRRTATPVYGGNRDRPALDPGDLSTLTATRTRVAITEESRRPGARTAARTRGEVGTGREPPGDRRRHGGRGPRATGRVRRPTVTRASASRSASKANPPGFDAQLIGLVARR